MTILEKFALAIQSFEGGWPWNRNMRNNNPGNLKITPYTQSLGVTSQDPVGFCIFPNYTTGFNALKQFIKDASQDKLRAYHQCSIQTFFNSYSDNSIPYAKYVAGKIGKKVDDLLKDFIV